MEQIKKDLTTQKPQLAKTNYDRKTWIVQYDRHGENAEFIETETDEIPEVESFKDIIKRGLQPETVKTKPVYGESLKMLTPIERIRLVKSRIAEATAKIEAAKNEKAQLEAAQKLQQEVKTAEINTTKVEDDKGGAENV